MIEQSSPLVCFWHAVSKGGSELCLVLSWTRGPMSSLRMKLDCAIRIKGAECDPAPSMVLWGVNRNDGGGFFRCGLATPAPAPDQTIERSLPITTKQSNLIWKLRR